MRADGASATGPAYGAATDYSPTDAFFDFANPYDQLGVTPAYPDHTTAQQIPGLARSTGPGGARAEHPPVWSPDNPMFWFGALLAVTTGLMAFSTTFGVRVGKGRARAGLEIGKGA